MKLRNITVQSIVEMVHPYCFPEEFSPPDTPEAIAPHRHWPEPWSVCPETGQFILAIQSWLARTEHHTIFIDTWYRLRQAQRESRPAQTHGPHLAAARVQLHVAGAVTFAKTAPSRMTWQPATAGSDRECYRDYRFG